MVEVTDATKATIIEYLGMFEVQGESLSRKIHSGRDQEWHSMRGGRATTQPLGIISPHGLGFTGFLSPPIPRRTGMYAAEPPPPPQTLAFLASIAGEGLKGTRENAE